MRDLDAVLNEIRRLTTKFRDGRISWDDAGRLGELVEQLDRAATSGVLPKQWHPALADTPERHVA